MVFTHAATSGILRLFTSIQWKHTGAANTAGKSCLCEHDDLQVSGINVCIC